LIFLVAMACLAQIQHTFIEKTPVFETEGSQLVDLAVDDNHLVLLMRSPPFVRVLNHSGSELSTWGARGEGPGSFTTPRDIQVVNDEVWVLNLVPHRLTVCALDGTVKSTTRLDDIFWLVRVEPFQGKALIEGGSWASSTHQLYGGEKGTTPIDTINRGPLVKLKPSSGPTSTIEAPFATRDHWAVMQGRHLVVNRSQSAAWVDIGSKKRWALPADVYRVPANGADIWLKRLFPGIVVADYAHTGWVKEAMAVPMPATFPTVLNLLVDGDHLWLHRAFTKTDQYWQCFQDGDMIRELRLPLDFYVYQIHSNRIYAVDLDHIDLPLVVHSFKE